MNVLLISANIEQIGAPVLPLGLARVAAATRVAGHDVFSVDLKGEANPKEALQKAFADFQPGVIGVSVRNIDDQTMASPIFLLNQARDVVAWCRDFSNAPVVVGGAGYSIFPESALDYLKADMGIQGEGEAAFPMLVEALERGGELAKVPGLCLPGVGIQQERVLAEKLDVFPFPDVSLLCPFSGEGEQPWIPVQTRRGCPNKCAYCSTAAIEGTMIRQHSPEFVVEGISRCVAEGFRQFVFIDSVFNLPPSYAKQLCRKLIEHRLDIRWWAIVYPKWIDEELAALMAEAGCMQVSLGFESGSNRVLKNLGKHFSTDEVRAISRLLKVHGIERFGFLLLGGPGETKETVAESFDFADSLELDFLRVSTGIRIYPNTRLAQQAVAEGIIPPQSDLLRPCFYLAKGLADWLPETVNEWKASRPYPIM